jgi:hypothetical protein
MPSTTAKMEIGQPRLFTARAVAVVCGYGAFLCIPVFLSVLVMSLRKFGVMSLLYPFLTMAATTWFLPFGFGNPYVARLVRAFHPLAVKDQDGFIVQLACSPRLRFGLRALLEDADDIGYLSFTESELVFEGDSIKLSVPFDQMKQVRPANVGLRGLFVYGRSSRIAVLGLPNVESLEFAERSSCFLPTSRKTARRLYERLKSVAAGDTGRARL